MNRTGKGGFAAHPENINRKGRPPVSKSFAEVLRAIGKELHNGEAALDAVCRTMWDLALGGDIQAVKWIADRVDGRTAQQIGFQSMELPAVQGIVVLEPGEEIEADDIVINAR